MKLTTYCNALNLSGRNARRGAGASNLTLPRPSGRSVSSLDCHTTGASSRTIIPEVEQRCISFDFVETWRASEPLELRGHALRRSRICFRRTARWTRLH